MKTKLPERSVLRLRTRGHVDGRPDDIVEVVRGGEVVATIYGSREGVHVVSECVGTAQPFIVNVPGIGPSWLLPMLGPDEQCPWCQNRGSVAVKGDDTMPCPVCSAL